MDYPQFPLQGQVALVAGAARGLGRAISPRLTQFPVSAIHRVAVAAFEGVSALTFIPDDHDISRRDVLSRPELQIRKGPRQQLFDLIRKRAHLIDAVQTVQISHDSEDNIFIECADPARADYPVTGNVRHSPRKNTKVVTSREFLSLVAPHLVG